MNSDQPPAIVVGGGRGALAALRSLDARSVPTLLVIADDRETAAASNSARHVVTIGGAQGSAVETLMSLPDRWAGAVVLETEDRYTLNLSEAHADLSRRYRLACGPRSSVDWFLDKTRTAELARRCGVPTPDGIRLTHNTDLAEVVDRVGLPAVVKPVRSGEFAARFGVKLWLVDTMPALATAARLAHDAGFDVVVQEFIPGGDLGTLESIEIYVNSDGSIGAEQFNVKHRQAPPGFGVMRAGVAIPPVADLHNGLHRMLSTIAYRGYASAEFKRCAETGVATLIEVNPRLPRNLQLMISSGVDYPWLIYRDLALGIRSTPQTTHRASFVDIVDDIRHSLTTDRRVLLTPRHLVAVYAAPNLHDAVIDRHDLGPFFRLIRNKIAKCGSTLRSVAGIFGRGLNGRRA